MTEFPNSSSGVVEGGLPRVLWADDHPIMREYVKTLLHNCYAVETVADGAAALASVRAHVPDLVLADVMMPRLDGVSLVRALRADASTRNVPIILISGRGSEQLKIEGLEAGADDYLAKPVTAQELLARVKSHIALVRMRRETAAREADLRAQLQFALEAGNLGSWQVDFSTGTLSASDLCKALYGRGPRDPLTFSEIFDLIHVEDRAEVHRAFQQSIKDGTDYEREYRIVLGNGRTRWIFARGRAAYSGDGEPRRMAGVLLDITVRKTAEQRLELLLQELNHRVKNTLATVHVIAAQTFTSTMSTEESLKRFEARLIALSKVHALLTEGTGTSALLRDVVLAALAPYDTGGGTRFRIDGPEVRLTAAAALALGMALHELVTNAGKYGALTAPSGSVEIKWELEPGNGHGGPHLVWRESGGPSVRAPERTGFGSKLIERVLAYELDARVKLLYEPTGVVCTMKLPESVRDESSQG